VIESAHASGIRPCRISAILEIVSVAYAIGTDFQPASRADRRLFAHWGHWWWPAAGRRELG
jgi:hypothetical protein